MFPNAALLTSKAVTAVLTTAGVIMRKINSSKTF